MKGTISLTFHEVDSATAHKLLEAVNGHKPDNQIELPLAAEPEAPAPEPKKEKASKKAEAEKAPPKKKAEKTEEPPAPEKAETPFPPTADQIGQLKDRDELLSLIAKLSDSEVDDVRDAFKGKRVKTLRTEAIAQLEAYLEDQNGDDVIDAELIDADGDAADEEPDWSEDEESEEESEEENEDEPAAGGKYDLKKIPKQIKNATRLRDVIKYMVGDGLETVDEVMAECRRLADSVKAIGETRSWEKRAKVVCSRLGVE